jgi:cytochrome o ubiquinol oxidase subunit II
MKKRFKIASLSLIVVVLLGIFVDYLTHTNIQILNPKGPIAAQERNLIYIALGLSLIVVIPVFAITIAIVVKYREGNHAKYSPNMDGNWIAETVWWIIPSAIIAVLAVIAWNSSHTLDPYRPISNGVTPLNIQVVALDWKWLFIYPEQNIATVNYFELPVNTPVNFQITADAPMNSFWIPQLGGQIYAMPGMNTQLNLLASSVGNYHGSSANISGSGFSSMDFTAMATSNANFLTWVGNVKGGSDMLDATSYSKLSMPSTSFPSSNYILGDSQLFLSILNKYLLPGHISGGSHNMYMNTASSSGMGMGM